VDSPILISDAQARQRPGQFAPVKVVGQHGGTGVETVGFSQVTGAGVPAETLPAQGDVVGDVRPVQEISPPNTILEEPVQLDDQIVQNWNDVANRFNGNDVVAEQPMPLMNQPEGILNRVLGDSRILERLTSLAMGGSRQAVNLLGRAYMYQFAGMMNAPLTTESFITGLENLAQLMLPGVATTAIVNYNQKIRKLFSKAQYDFQQLQIKGIQDVGAGIRQMIVYARTPTIQDTLDAVANGGAVQTAFNSLLALFMYTLQMSINPGTRAALMGRMRDGRSYRLARAVPRTLHNVGNF
jgi:hypothetical protein